MFTIIGAIILAYRIAGGSLLAILAVNIGTDLLIGIIMASDAFGPIVDNAAGIAKIGKAAKKVFESLSHLDAVGNTLKATTKSYAMASGTITAFVLFATFFTITGNTVLEPDHSVCHRFHLCRYFTPLPDGLHRDWRNGQNSRINGG